MSNRDIFCKCFQSNFLDSSLKQWLLDCLIETLCAPQLTLTSVSATFNSNGSSHSIKHCETDHKFSSSRKEDFWNKLDRKWTPYVANGWKVQTHEESPHIFWFSTTPVPSMAFRNSFVAFFMSSFLAILDRKVISWLALLNIKSLNESLQHGKYFLHPTKSRCWSCNSPALVLRNFCYKHQKAC